MISWNDVTLIFLLLCYAYEKIYKNDIDHLSFIFSSNMIINFLLQIHLTEILMYNGTETLYDVWFRWSSTRGYWILSWFKRKMCFWWWKMWTWYIIQKFISHIEEWSSTLSPIDSTLSKSNKIFICNIFMDKFCHFFWKFGLKRGVSKFS